MSSRTATPVHKIVRPSVDTTESTSTAAPKSSHGLPFTGSETELGRCQVGSETDRPCPRPATVRVLGVPFCERCAREQEAYFAVGELTQELTNDRTKRACNFLVERLDEPLYGLRWKLDGQPRRNGEARGGRIEVQSILGEGSAFTVRLPLSEKIPERESLSGKS